MDGVCKQKVAGQEKGGKVIFVLKSTELVDLHVILCIDGFLLPILINSRLSKDLKIGSDFRMTRATSVLQSFLPLTFEVYIGVYLL